jgi:hypothetical protein
MPIALVLILILRLGTHHHHHRFNAMKYYFTNGNGWLGIDMPMVLTNNALTV